MLSPKSPFAAFALVCLFFPFFLSCRDAVREETGVSLVLAESRKENISGVEYRLEFNIPEDDSPVSGEVEIGFEFSGAGDVVIDFRPGEENVISVMTNGRPVKALVGNEHIVIPSGKLHKGHNAVSVSFISQDQSLNRNSDYLYTLLVPDRARTVFPCFDQPDMKAHFFLSLEIPSQWKALANGELIGEEAVGGNRKRLSFGDSGLISTYLFAFTAGVFNEYTAKIGDRDVTALYRETDPKKIAQMEDIFSEVGEAISFMEDYTGVPYPFGKYGFAILPGFQFGGMEHPGAIFFTDRRMFLPEHPTTSERISRVELISHETAHMWFGDMVTMKWFDDVWTKEVFANHFAALLSAGRFGEIDSSVNDFSNFNILAYNEDRSAGTVPLSQPLGNLQDAGLVYGNIVYDKAPVVMRMLSSMMGEEPFREGIREYLRTYGYSNATWDDLIGILDKCSERDLVSWSGSWVHSEGMPHISARLDGQNLIVSQEDPLGRGIVWPQEVDFTIMKDGKKLETVSVWMDEPMKNISMSEAVPEDAYVVPNLSATAYGFFKMDEKDILGAIDSYPFLEVAAERISVLASFHENYLAGMMDPAEFADFLSAAALSEKDPLVAGAAVSYLKSLSLHGTLSGSQSVEKKLYDLSVGALSEECRLSAFRALLGVFRSEKITGELYSAWENEESFHGIHLGERDKMTMAYELAIRLPEKAERIRDIQLSRMTDPDRKREFSFVFRAVDPDEEKRDSLMESFLERENRTSEPWVNTSLGYLNHTLRQKEAVKYIRPALEELLEIQKTGDIFFPKNWITAVLSQHDSPEAVKEVQSFLSERPDYPSIMKNKILQSADYLFRGTNARVHSTGRTLRPVE